MGELISIIVPVYKVEPYLSRCLDSILNQTYRELEVILVDDGSPDRCGIICDEYAAKDKRVRVIHKANGGLSDARNSGIEAANGEILSFIDSDDWVDQRYVEFLYGLLKTKEADISVCNFLRVLDDNTEAPTETGETYEFSNIDALLQYNDRFSTQMVVAWGKLYKKDLFQGIRFPLGRFHEDEFTTYKVIYKANKIVFSTQQLVCYRQRNDSIMGQNDNLKGRIDAVDALLERSAFYESKNLPLLRECANKTLFHFFRFLFRYSRKYNEVIPSFYLNSFSELKIKLRNGRYKTINRLFFEFYFLFPSLSDLLFDIYSFIKYLSTIRFI